LVGVLSFENFVLNIRPKLIGVDSNLLELIAITSDLDNVIKFLRYQDIDAEQNDLIDLMAFMFVQACELVLREGIFSDYILHEDNIPVIRGRFLARSNSLKIIGILKPNLLPFR